MRSRCTMLAIILLLAAVPLALADEGMWLFNAFPSDKVKAKYGFGPDQAWLDRVRESSVRFNNGGSGSLVSPDGLTFTNHHVGRTCIHQISTADHDYDKTGFYAATRDKEAKCPDLELNVLVGIEDVTAKVTAADKPGMNDAQKFAARRAATAQIEKDCVSSSGQRCDVETFYSGSLYHLYKYKKYTDVRLVFAPEFDIAFFGGDPDNFEYPRYDLDISFFRIYENDKPAQLPSYLKWSLGGVKEGDLVFVSGHPGSTGRLLTMSQLAYLREVEYPWRIKSLRRRADYLKQWSAGSPEKFREASEDIFGIENSFKALTGYQSGLTDQRLMAKKAADEESLKGAVSSDPKKKAEFGDPWAELDKAVAVNREIHLPWTFWERRAALRGDLAARARILVRAAQEKRKPNGERLPEYRDSALPSLEQELFSTAPLYPDFETALLTESLEEATDNLGRDDAVLQQVLAGKSPADRAREIATGSKLYDLAVRKQLYEGGWEAVEKSDDPMIAVMRTADVEARKWRKRHDGEIEAVEQNAGARLAKARFAQGGLSMPPDATFTLRLSYGAVRSYMDKGKRIPYFTTMGGAYQHATAHGNKDPYKLPESWMKSKTKLNLTTPLNNVSTPDIIGGNSGSPVINTGGEVTGIIFDGNIPSLPWNFVYDDTVGRSVSVDGRGIIEALRKIYGADALANELLGSRMPRGPVKPRGKTPR